MAQFILVDGSKQDFVSSQPNGKSTLKELQDRVGGNIEPVKIPVDGKIMIVNEDGNLLKLALNTEASLIARRPIVGTAVIMDHAEWFDDNSDCDDDEFDDCDDLDDEDNDDEREWDEDLPF